jgi:hypothetical protein
MDFKTEVLLCRDPVVLKNGLIRWSEADLENNIFELADKKTAFNEV